MKKRELIKPVPTLLSPQEVMEKERLLRGAIDGWIEPEKKPQQKSWVHGGPPGIKRIFQEVRNVFIFSPKQRKP